MIRQAAISLGRRGGGISYRQSLPKCTQTLIQNSTLKIGGCRQQNRLLTTKTTTSSTTPKVSTKDKGQEALEKSQRLHAELKEVSIYFFICFSLCILNINISHIYQNIPIDD